MSVDHVVLIAVDEEVLEKLLGVAVQEAAPGEVMAPVEGPPGWTEARRDAFTDYHRSRRVMGSVPFAEATYAVTVDGEVVGSARLAAVEGDPAALEVGLWLGRRWRGRGIGSAVLPVAADAARRLGATRLIANTSASNDAAVAVLRGKEFSLDTDATGSVGASLPLR
jgi:RimJ/RimL family protein N-acetyltransferase